VKFDRVDEMVVVEAGDQGRVESAWYEYEFQAPSSSATSSVPTVVGVAPVVTADISRPMWIDRGEQIIDLALHFGVDWRDQLDGMSDMGEEQLRSGLQKMKCKAAQLEAAGERNLLRSLTFFVDYTEAALGVKEAERHTVDVYFCIRYASEEPRPVYLHLNDTVTMEVESACATPTGSSEALPETLRTQQYGPFKAMADSTNVLRVGLRGGGETSKLGFPNLQQVVVFFGGSSIANNDRSALHLRPTAVHKTGLSPQLWLERAESTMELSEALDEYHGNWRDLIISGRNQRLGLPLTAQLMGLEAALSIARRSANMPRNGRHLALHYLIEFTQHRLQTEYLTKTRN
jgi:hypothetical protein